VLKELSNEVKLEDTLPQKKPMSNQIIIGQKELDRYIITGLRLTKTFNDLTIYTRGERNIGRALLLARILKRDGLEIDDMKIKEVKIIGKKDQKELVVFEIQIHMKKVQQ